MGILKKKNNKYRRTFFDDKNPQFSELKWIFFQLEHSKSQMFQISINLFGLSFILKKNNKNRRTFFFKKKVPDTHKEFEKKNQNFGTKVDFFPIGKFRIQNFRNTKKFISAQLQIKKIKKKIREP